MCFHSEIVVLFDDPGKKVGRTKLDKNCIILFNSYLDFKTLRVIRFVFKSVLKKDSSNFLL